MKLALFVDTVSGRFLCFPTSRIELAAPTLTRGDKIPVELRFITYGVEVAPPAAAKLGVGTVGNLCALTTAWEASGNALTGVLDLDTLELTTLLGDAPKLYDATLELEYVDAGNTRTVSRSCTIKNDLIRPAPAVLNPALHYATEAALNALKAQVDSIPGADLSGINSAITTLSNELDALAQTIPAAVDLTPLNTSITNLTQQLSTLQTQVDGLTAPDLSGINSAIAQLNQDLDALAQSIPAAVDLAPLNQAIASLTGRVEALEEAPAGGTVDLTPITQRLDAIDAAAGAPVIAAQVAAVKAQAAGAKATLVALNEFLGGYAGQEPVITVITTAITALDAFAANPAPVKADLDAILAGMSGLGYPPGLRGSWEWNSDTDDRIAIDRSVAYSALNSAGTTLDAVNTVGATLLGSASALAAIETLIIGIKNAASNTASSLDSTQSQIYNLTQQISPVQQQIADKAPLRRPIVPVYASRELNGLDYDSYVRVYSETDVTLTIPPGLWFGETAGPEFDIMRAGAGSVTFAAGAGVTINSAGGKLSIATQFAGASLKHVVGNTWDLVGALS